MRLSVNGKVLSFVEKNDVKSGVLYVPESVEYITASFKSLAGVNIKKIVLPNVRTIYPKTFSNLTIEEVIAPNVTKISSEAFADCKELKIVKSPKLEIIEDKAFIGCFNLQSIDLLFIKKIGNDAFEYSDNLEVFDNLTYTKIGFNKKMSNYSIIKVALEKRLKKGLEPKKEKPKEHFVNYSRKIIYENPNYQPKQDVKDFE